MAIVGWDGQVEDDARLVVAVARTAAAYGAEVLTHVDAVAVGDGRATLRDETGEFTIDCDQIITCTGVWTEELNPEIRLSPSRGTHLVIPSERLGHPTASMTVAIPEEFGRFVFAIPQPDGLTYVGLTDLPTESLLPDPPEPTTEEIDWLRERISAALAVPLHSEDVIGTFSGLRPLVSDAHAQTADISRKHLVARQPDGIDRRDRRQADGLPEDGRGRRGPHHEPALPDHADRPGRGARRQSQPRPPHPPVRV